MYRFLILMAVPFLFAPAADAILDQSKFSPKMKDLVDTLHSTCVGKSGTDEASISKGLKGEFDDEPKIKAYIKCLFMESGAIDDSGTWNMDLAADMLPADIKDTVLNTLKTCDGKTNSIGNMDDRLFAFIKCGYDVNPDLFIFF